MPLDELVRVELLISRLNSENEAWRVDAEIRLVAIGEDAVGVLLGATKHASAAVRLHSVRALSRIGSPRGLEAIIDALADDENLGAVAMTAEKALVFWGEEAKPALLQAAKQGPVRTRARALRALGRIGGDDLEKPLMQWLGDDSSAVRLQAAIALAGACGTLALNALCALLEDPDKWVRYGVAEELVRLGSVQSEQVLKEAAADPEEEGQHMQYLAVELLEEIEDLKRSGAAIV